MEQFVIQGGKPLRGAIDVRGAKNAAFPILAATILTDEDCIVENLPLVEDVYRMLEILEGMGAKVEWLDERTVKINTRVLDPKKVKKGYMIWAIVLLCFGFVGLVIFPIWPVGLGLMAGGVVMFAYAHIMPARTQNGVQIHDSLLGLKDYIKLAEAERLKFGQSPEGAQ